MLSHPERGSKGTWVALGTSTVRVGACREKPHNPCPRKVRGAALGATADSAGAPFTTLPQRALAAQLRQQPPRGPLLHPPPCFLPLPTCCCDLDARPTSHSLRRADGPGARCKSQLRSPPSKYSVKRTRGTPQSSQHRPPPHSRAGWPHTGLSLFPPISGHGIHPFNPLPSGCLFLPRPPLKPSRSPPQAPPDWQWLQPEPPPPPPMPLTAAMSHC